MEGLSARTLRRGLELATTYESLGMESILTRIFERYAMNSTKEEQRAVADAEAKSIIKKLWRDIKRDMPFFGMCGAIVGLFLILNSRLIDQHLVHGEKWPMALFGDFMSINAFAFVFVGLIALGATATILESYGLQTRRLNMMVKHLEGRLTQIASSIMCFTAGLSLIASSHSLLTRTSGGFLLTILIVGFNFILYGSYFCAVLMARRVGPWGNPKAAGLALTMALGCLTWFVLNGGSAVS